MGDFYIVRAVEVCGRSWCSVGGHVYLLKLGFFWMWVVGKGLLLLWDGGGTCREAGYVQTQTWVLGMVEGGSLASTNSRSTRSGDCLPGPSGRLRLGIIRQAPQGGCVTVVHPLSGEKEKVGQEG